LSQFTRLTDRRTVGFMITNTALHAVQLLQCGKKIDYSLSIQIQIQFY